MPNWIEPHLVTTANDIPGYRVTRNLGMVRGVTVRSRSVFGTLGASLQTLVGEISPCSPSFAKRLGRRPTR